MNSLAVMMRQAAKITVVLLLWACFMGLLVNLILTPVRHTTPAPGMAGQTAVV